MPFFFQNVRFSPSFIVRLKSEDVLLVSGFCVNVIWLLGLRLTHHAPDLWVNPSSCSARGFVTSCSRRDGFAMQQDSWLRLAEAIDSLFTWDMYEVTVGQIWPLQVNLRTYLQNKISSLGQRGITFVRGEEILSEEFCSGYSDIKITGRFVYVYFLGFLSNRNKIYVWFWMSPNIFNENYTCHKSRPVLSRAMLWSMEDGEFWWWDPKTEVWPCRPFRELMPIRRKWADDEYKHGFAIPKTHIHLTLTTARPGVQSTPDCQYLAACIPTALADTYKTQVLSALSHLGYLPTQTTTDWFPVLANLTLICLGAACLHWSLSCLLDQCCCTSWGNIRRFYHWSPPILIPPLINQVQSHSRRIHTQDVFTLKTHSHSRRIHLNWTDDQARASGKQDHPFIVRTPFMVWAPSGYSRAAILWFWDVPRTPPPTHTPCDLQLIWAKYSVYTHMAVRWMSRTPPPPTEGLKRGVDFPPQLAQHYFWFPQDVKKSPRYNGTSVCLVASRKVCLLWCLKMLGCVQLCSKRKYRCKQRVKTKTPLTSTGETVRDWVASKTLQTSTIQVLLRQFRSIKIVWNMCMLEYVVWSSQGYGKASL